MTIFIRIHVIIVKVFLLFIARIARKRWRNVYEYLEWKFTHSRCIPAIVVDREFEVSSSCLKSGRNAIHYLLRRPEIFGEECGEEEVEI